LNAKIVVPGDTQLINVIGELAGVAPEAPKTVVNTTPVRK
jgi:hypothetical protein